MLGMTIAVNPALTFYLFKDVLVASPSSKLNSYGATRFSLRDKFPEQFQIVKSQETVSSFAPITIKSFILWKNL